MEHNRGGVARTWLPREALRVHLQHVGYHAGCALIHAGSLPRFRTLTARVRLTFRLTSMARKRQLPCPRRSLTVRCRAGGRCVEPSGGLFARVPAAVDTVAALATTLPVGDSELVRRMADQLEGMDGRPRRRAPEFAAVCRPHPSHVTPLADRAAVILRADILRQAVTLGPSMWRTQSGATRGSRSDDRCRS